SVPPPGDADHKRQSSNSQREGSLPGDVVLSAMDSLRSRLEREGLGKYAELFAEHSIGADVLADLTEADLEKLGMPMGDRRRFLKAPWRMMAGDAPQTPVVEPPREAERRQLTV